MEYIIKYHDNKATILKIILSVAATIVVFWGFIEVLNGDLAREWLSSRSTFIAEIVVLGVLGGAITIITTLINKLTGKKIRLIMGGSVLNINNGKIAILYSDITKLTLKPVYGDESKYVSGYTLKIYYGESKKLRLKVGGVSKKGVMAENTKILLDFHTNLTKKLALFAK